MRFVISERDGKLVLALTLSFLAGLLSAGLISGLLT